MRRRRRHSNPPDVVSSLSLPLSQASPIAMCTVRLSAGAAVCETTEAALKVRNSAESRLEIGLGVWTEMGVIRRWCCWVSWDFCEKIWDFRILRFEILRGEKFLVVEEFGKIANAIGNNTNLVHVFGAAFRLLLYINLA